MRLRPFVRPRQSLGPMPDAETAFETPYLDIRHPNSFIEYNMFQNSLVVPRLECLVRRSVPWGADAGPGHGEQFH